MLDATGDKIIGRAHVRLGAAILLALVAGCGRPASVAVTPPDAGMVLDRCQEQRESPEVTAWHCGDLTAIEAVVLAASEREIAMAFDDFASNFGGTNVRR